MASGVLASGVAAAWQRVEGGEGDWGFPLGLTRRQEDKATGGNLDALSGRRGGAHVSASESTRESVRCSFEKLATFLSCAVGPLCQ